MTQITIKDIARKLGLSPSTVSRALNDHPYIKSETKKLVKNLAESLGYEPNIVARSLQAKGSNQIGIIVPEIKHDFFAKAISGIEDVAYQEGYTVIVSQSNEEAEREKTNAEALFKFRAAGLIVSLSQTTRDISVFKNLIKKGVKIVFFDRVTEELECHKVLIDDYHASFEAVDFLVKSGYKKILHLAGPQTLMNCRQRLEGYKAALEKNGMELDDNLIIVGGMHESDGINSVKSALENGVKFDAVFAVNDPAAIGAALHLRNVNIKIPDDVAIIGFSNNPITEYFTPTMSTIEQPAYEMGKSAASMLLSLIKNEKVENKRVTLPTKLIIRESVRSK